MSNESLVDIVKKVDQKVLKDYTQLAKKLHLDEGKGRYFAALGFNLAGVFLLGTPMREWGGAALDWGYWAATQFVDGIYCWYGIFGLIKDEEAGDARALSKEKNIFKTINTYLRLPSLAAGVGAVGVYVVDRVTGGGGDPHVIQYGLGMIALASSMYIKEIDPKLLERQEERAPVPAPQEHSS